MYVHLDLIHIEFKIDERKNYLIGMQIDIEFKIDKKKYLIGMQIDIEDKIDNKKYLLRCR